MPLTFPKAEHKSTIRSTTSHSFLTNEIYHIHLALPQQPTMANGTVIREKLVIVKKGCLAMITKTRRMGHNGHGLWLHLWALTSVKILR